MRLRAPLFALLITLSATALAESDFEALVAAERRFAADAAAGGVVAAYRLHLADDAVIFRPGPVPGREWYARAPEAPFQLQWAPAQAEIAASGDLGYTFGPFLLRADRERGAEPRGGHFLSIWQRGADGRFRVVLDQGISHAPQPLAAAVDRRGPKPPEAAAPRLDAAATNARNQALIARDRALAAALAQGHGGGALRELLSDDAISFRNGVGPRRALAAAGDEAVPAMELATLRISAAGDLGVTAGWSGEPSAPWSYVRVWRWRDGDWRLAIDLLTP